MSLAIGIPIGIPFRPYSGRPGFAVAGATYAVDFLQQLVWTESTAGQGVVQSVASATTFTRASTGTYFDSAGVLQTAATDVRRFDYSPTTLAPLGVLIEGARTNSIRNNTMVGAVPGTPGTLPTNWNIAGSPTQQVVGTGTENGIEYIDVRFSGTPSTFGLAFEATTQIAATDAQQWATSVFVKLVSGSLSGITLTLNMVQRTGAGASLTTINSSSFTPTTAALSTQRRTLAGTTNEPTIAYIQPRLLFTTTGAAIDVTLRVGLPQIEQASFSSSTIKTTTAAVTRATDVLTAAVGGWFNASEGTFVAESNRIASGPASTFPRVLHVDDGTVNDAINVLWATNPAKQYLAVLVGGVLQTDIGQTGLTQTAINKIAAAYKTNDFAVSVNGGAAATDTSGSIPTGLTTVRFGDAAGGASTLFGYIRRVSYIPRRVTDAALPSLSA